MNASRLTLAAATAWLCTCTTASALAQGPSSDQDLAGSASGEPGFAELGNQIDGRPQSWWSIDGYLRTRGEWLNNLDLDRGLDPAGKPLYVVPPSAPGAQSLRHADLRLRTDATVRTPRGGGAVVVRLDWLDGLALGSAPNAAPTAATGQLPPASLATVRRAYGMIALPFGALALGRMNGHWGLGMVSHGGDGLDSDYGDAADRLAFVTPLVGHLWAISYDWSSTGPAAARPGIGGTAAARSIDLDPSDDVRSVTFAVLKWRDALTHQRRRQAGKTTLEYGVFGSRRWQDRDAPATWASSVPPAELGSAAWMRRDLDVLAGDCWLRVSGPWGRVEAEAFGLTGAYQQASLIPGVQLRDPIELRQLGAALQSRLGSEQEGLSFGLDAGAASGDPGPGWGSFAAATARAGQPGVFRAAQIDAPRDNMLSELHFAADYRVDRILFREILGAVADAAYVRPHIRYTVAELGAGQLVADLALIQSWAIQASTTPGGQTNLGFEVDPTLTYRSRDGIDAALAWASFVPGSAFDNPGSGAPGSAMTARAAHLARLTLRWRF